MAVKRAMSMRTARKRAMMARKRGFEASVFKTKRGPRVSVTRK